MLRANGRSTFIYFMFFSSPGCFLLVSLMVAVTAAAICELERSRLAEAARKEKEFGQVVKALKRRDEEEVNLVVTSESLKAFFVETHQRLRQYSRRRPRQRVTMTTAGKAKSHNQAAKVHTGVLSG